MKEKRGLKKEKAIFIIVDLVLSLFAFSFIIWNVGVASGQETRGLLDIVRAEQAKKLIDEHLKNNNFFASSQILEAVREVEFTNEEYLTYLNKINVAQREYLMKGVMESKPGGNPLPAKVTEISPTSVYVSYDLEKSYDFTIGTEKVPAKTLHRLGNEFFVKSGEKYVPIDKNLLAEKGIDVSKLKPSVTDYPKPLGLDLGFGWGHIAQGALWAVAVYGGVKILGSILGLKPETTNALATAAAGGLFIGKAAYGIFGPGGLAGTSLPGGLIGATGIGIVAGLLILELTYKKESKRTVTFECNPWEAPAKGENCEKCNSDLYPCTEYRCKSLGQACQLLNPGTGQEKCAWVNPNDVNSPIIQADANVLTFEHKYVPNNAIRPPDRGVKIQYTKASDGCIKAFSPLEFGIQVNEPAQCKIDYNRTNKYDEMQYYFGNSNIYKYNHTQTLRLPSPDAINNDAGPEIKADGNYNLFVRCKDANKNENADMFVFSFCVEKGPDVTAPKIEATSIANNMPVQYGLNETFLEVYVNEPSECKWDRLDMSYDSMNNAMTCSQHVWEMNNLMLYKCSTTLTGLKSGNNEFFFKCKDQPYLKGTDKEADRNVNTESYKFVLKGSPQPLVISEVKPNGTIQGAGTLAILYLELKTEYGSNNGDAWCSYSETQNEKDYIQMYETGTNKHRQRLDLPSGNYTYYFQCVDLGGNSARNSTNFAVEIDVNAPVVVRVYNEAGKLKIITNEKSTCSYSNNEERKCSFLIPDGTNMPYVNSTEHFAEWKANKNYYIKCQDLQGRQPLPTECSIIVKPQS